MKDGIINLLGRDWFYAMGIILVSVIIGGITGLGEIFVIAITVVSVLCLWIKYKTDKELETATKEVEKAKNGEALAKRQWYDAETQNEWLRLYIRCFFETTKTGEFDRFETGLEEDISGGIMRYDVSSLTHSQVRTIGTKIKKWKPLADVKWDTKFKILTVIY